MKKKSLTKQALESTEQNKAEMLAENDALVEKARQNKYADENNLRKNRAAEKTRINKEDALSKRFAPTVEVDKQPETAEQPEIVKSLPDPEKKFETSSEPVIKTKLTLEEKIAQIGKLANEYIK